MAHPRGARVRTFPTSSRAVVREAEWMVNMQRVANELKPLVKLAKDQGWTIEAAQNGSKLVWRGPQGQGPVYTGYRCQGRDLMNYRAELVRAGLRLDEAQARDHVSETQVEELVEQVDELNLEEIKSLFNQVNTVLPILHAKAETYDRARANAKEWQEIAEDAQKAAEEAIRKLTELQTTIDAIRTCFSMSPWAILPEIAKLLNIDPHDPSTALIPTKVGAK